MTIERIAKVIATSAVAVLMSFLLPGGASAGTTTLKFAQFRSPSDVVAKPWLEGMSKEVEEKTEGRVKIKIYWAGALGAGRDEFYMVRDGIADMADFPGSWIPGKFPECEVANLPFAADDPMNVVKAMAALTAKGYFKAWNEVEVLEWHATTPYDIFFRKEKPMKFEELSGIKVRSPGGVINDYLKSIGMIPVKVLPSDAYMAWETGIVDAWLHMPTSGIRYKFIELPTKAVLDANVMILGNAATFINKDKFASLSENDQKVLREVVRKHGESYVRNTMKQDEIAIKKMADVGIETYRMPDPEMQKMRAAGLPVWTKFIDDLEAKGLPGKQLVADYVKVLTDLGEHPIYQP